MRKGTRTKETGNDVHELSGINAASCRSRRDNTNLNDQTRLDNYGHRIQIRLVVRKKLRKKEKKRNESHACVQ